MDTVHANITGRRNTASLPLQVNVLSRKAYTIPQFCEAHGISRAFFYVLAGNGTKRTTALP